MSARGSAHLLWAPAAANRPAVTQSMLVYDSNRQEVLAVVSSPVTFDRVSWTGRLSFESAELWSYRRGLWSKIADGPFGARTTVELAVFDPPSTAPAGARGARGPSS